MPEQVIDVPISKLVESPDNPRKLFGNMTELAESIKKQGILEPIIARKRNDGTLEINNGHRRVRAAKLAGLKEVPVIVREMNRQSALEKMIVENKQREDVNDLELADGYRKLMADYGLSANEVADRTGASRSSVYDSTRLLDLSEPVQKAVLAGKLSTANGLDIVKVRGERLQLDAMRRALALTRKGEKTPNSRAVKQMIQDVYFSSPRSKAHGNAKAKREVAVVGEDVAIRRRVVARLIRRVAELIERRAQLDETDLRTGVLALAELLGEPARKVFQRRGLRVDRLAKVAGAQLRSLQIEMLLEAWLTLDEKNEYSAQVRATAKAYNLSLSELTAGVEATESAEALFEKA